MQLCVVQALALAAALWTSAAVTAAPQLAALKRAVADAESRSVRTGVAVSDASGRVLYRHRATEAFTPASNMKLLTAAGVLRGLGSDFEFVTEFRVEGGELLVVASGDPNWLQGSAHDPKTIFRRVAQELLSRKLTQIRGVRLLAGSFVGPSRPPTWPKDQFYAYYCAPTGGFVLEQGAFVMRIQRSGTSKARVQLVAPEAGYPIRGAVAEVSSRKGAVYGAIDAGGSVRVKGKFYKKSPSVEIKTSMNDPARWYRDTLVHQLQVAGVQLRAAAPAVATQTIYTHRSGLRPALRRMLEDSSNFAAEQCLRVLGDETTGDGSLRGGRAALEAQITKLIGVVPDGVAIVDGSGLSKENRVTPGTILVTMFQSIGGPGGEVLRDALPVAGKTGTLLRRFGGTDLVGRVHAKTGWIRGASSLSGLVELGDGSVRWFSILMNYDRGRGGLNKDLKRIQERIVRAVEGLEGKG